MTNSEGQTAQSHSAKGLAKDCCRHLRSLAEVFLILVLIALANATVVSGVPLRTGVAQVGIPGRVNQSNDCFSACMLPMTSMNCCHVLRRDTLITVACPSHRDVKISCTT